MQSDKEEENNSRRGMYPSGYKLLRIISIIALIAQKMLLIFYILALHYLHVASQKRTASSYDMVRLSIIIALLIVTIISGWIGVTRQNICWLYANFTFICNWITITLIEIVYNKSDWKLGTKFVLLTLSLISLIVSIMFIRKVRQISWINIRLWKKWHSTSLKSVWNRHFN